MAKEYVAILVPREVKKAIKRTATNNDRTMIEELRVTYDK